MKIEAKYTVDGKVTPIIGDPPFQKLDERKVQLLRVRIYELEQDLLRTEWEKVKIAGDLESNRSQLSRALSEVRLLLNERATVLMTVRRTWVRLGKWLGVPQGDDR